MKIRLSTLINSIVIITGIITGSLGAWLLWQGEKSRSRIDELFFDDTLYADEIQAAADRYGLRPELIRAVIKRESRFNRNQKGKAGEIGLMQLLPSGAAAEWARVNKLPQPSTKELFDPETNINIGSWYLARAVKKWKKYRHCTELALAEYNAGPTNSARWKPANPNDPVINRIDFPGTRKYVNVIMASYREYLLENKD